MYTDDRSVEIEDLRSECSNATAASNDSQILSCTNDTRLICDGVQNCDDCSDEIEATCEATVCPHGNVVFTLFCHLKKTQLHVC